MIDHAGVTGAEASEVLQGIHASNQGLEIRVFQKQSPGNSGRVMGAFEILAVGKGTFENAIRRVVHEARIYPDASDFIRSVSLQPGGETCSHILDRNLLVRRPPSPSSK